MAMIKPEQRDDVKNCQKLLYVFEVGKLCIECPEKSQKNRLKIFFKTIFLEFDFFSLNSFLVCLATSLFYHVRNFFR